jgi:transcriptional regulator with XRE-family HTH domain
VTTREGPAARGARRGRFLRQRLSQDLVAAQQGVGLSLTDLARALGVSRDKVTRALRGEPAALTVDFAARLAPLLGLELAASLYPQGDPIRDKGHVALLQRFRRLVAPEVGWRTEVPVPITGDLRSADAWLELHDGGVLIEAETHLGDAQAVERKAFAKARDLGADRVILLLSDTPHNRRIVSEVDVLRERFPVQPRVAMAAIREGRDPGGDAIVFA